MRGTVICAEKVEFDEDMLEFKELGSIWESHKLFLRQIIVRGRGMEIGVSKSKEWRADYNISKENLKFPSFF